MLQYLDLCRHILAEGEQRGDRTGTGTLSVFGPQVVYDLQKGFPLITTKDMQSRFPLIVHELLWFLKGDTHLRYLVENEVGIWHPDAHRAYRDSGGTLSLVEFKEKTKTDPEFLSRHGFLGPIYGKQWRSWGKSGKDQIQDVVHLLKTNPESRRILVSAWNVDDLDEMVLPPCHVLFQFYVRGDYLDCKLYQRSADVFLGVPFNIASYALLLTMMATVTGLKPGRFIHSFGDAHIYLNHLEQVKTQLSREPYPAPVLKLNYHGQAIDEFTLEDFELLGYNSHPELKGKVSAG